MTDTELRAIAEAARHALRLQANAIAHDMGRSEEWADLHAKADAIIALLDRLAALEAERADWRMIAEDKQRKLDEAHLELRSLRRTALERTKP